MYPYMANLTIELPERKRIGFTLDRIVTRILTQKRSNFWFESCYTTIAGHVK